MKLHAWKSAILLLAVAACGGTGAGQESTRTQSPGVTQQGGSGPGPYGAKAVAELSNVTIPAAVANAVARACGARVTEVPVSAERVLSALRSRVAVSS